MFLLMMGLALPFCIIVIGIPFVIISVIASPFCFIASFFAKGSKCSNCEYKLP